MQVTNFNFRTVRWCSYQDASGLTFPNANFCRTRKHAPLAVGRYRMFYGEINVMHLSCGKMQEHSTNGYKKSGCSNMQQFVGWCSGGEALVR